MATHLDETSVEAAPLRSPSDSERYLNRELSWLDFNARVLCLAEDETTPPLERAKFLAIFAENLDEFFQVRVAGLKDQQDAGLRATLGSGGTPAAQLLAIREQAESLVQRSVQVFLKSVAPSLGEHGVVLSEWD